MERSLHHTHVKLLAFDLNSLTRSPSDPPLFSRDGASLSRVEVAGVVTSCDNVPDRFFRFAVDDGTGCVACIIWLNQLVSPYFARRSRSDLQAIAAAARNSAKQVTLGAVVKVRGRVTSFRGLIQVTASDVVAERDPNSEMLHWLECMRLARVCYDSVRPSRR